MLLEVYILDRKKRSKSLSVLINISVMSIIVLTGLLAFSVFITFSEIYPQMMFQLAAFFRNNRWWILSFAILLTALLVVFVIIFNLRIESFTNKRIRKMYRELETKTLQGITHLPMGVISYEEDNIIWANKFFTSKQKDKLIGKPIKQIFVGADEHELHQVLDIRENWQMYPQMHLFGRTLDIYHDTSTQMFYMFDKTIEESIRLHAEANQMIVGYIYTDMQDEIQVLEDSSNLDIGSEIHRIIVSWAQKYNGYARKYSSYRWMILLTKENLDQMIKDNMTLRTSIKQLAEEMAINVTISGGFAAYRGDMTDTIKNAVNAIELGQSRGGDQIVIHNHSNGEDLIIGGNNNQKRRTSRVMARSTAIALHTELEKRDVVYVTGHQYADMDAIGAMLGIYQIAKAERKEVYFVLDTEKVSVDVTELAKKIWHDAGNLENMVGQIIKPDQFTVQNMKANSVVVIVDTGTVNLLETPFLADAENIILIDHHRKGRGSVKNTVIEYIDPFSSSSSELVTELMQYLPIDVEVPNFVATFLLAGIILDTQNFTRSVSSRTFEAASYLRKQGAIQTHILNVLTVGIDEYLEQSKYLLNSEKLPGEGRIVLLDEDVLPRQKIAKCAEFLLDFPEVKYAIAIGKVAKDELSISARSKGSVNIQRIMENLGGGGHFNSAAAQMIDVSLEEAKAQVIASLTKDAEKDDTREVVLKD